MYSCFMVAREKMMTHEILNMDPKDDFLKAEGSPSRTSWRRSLGERMTDEELQDMIGEAEHEGCIADPAQGRFIKL